MTFKILLVDNKPTFAAEYKGILESRGYTVFVAHSYKEGEDLLANVPIDLAIVDRRLEDDAETTDNSGIEFIHKVAPEVPKILLTAFPDFETVRAVMQSMFGEAPPVKTVVGKSEGPEALLNAIKWALAKKKKRRQKANIWAIIIALVAFASLGLLLWERGFVGLVIAVGSSVATKIFVEFLFRRLSQ